MRAEIVTIGTELLLGEIHDTNATWMAQQFREIGLDLLYRTTVGDNEQRIAEVIDNALNRVDVVVTSGGLGPTVDDVTREGIAGATGRPLVFQQELLDQIAERFRRFNVTMSDNNRRQAYVPEGANPIENPVGTAPIFILETERGVVMVTPGVPREMKHLMEHNLMPWLRDAIGAPATIVRRVLRTAGIGESQIDSRIGDLMTASNPTVGLAAHTSQTDIRITAKADTPEAAHALIEPVEAILKKRLGRWIYGTEEQLLEEVVLNTLQSKSCSVATIEVGTGGLLKSRLRQVDDNGQIFRSGAAFSRRADIAVDGVSAELPFGELGKAVAEAVRRQHETTFGVAVIMRLDENEELGTEIVCAGPDDAQVRTFNWLNDRPDAPAWATTHALAMLRRRLMGIEEE